MVVPHGAGGSRDAGPPDTRRRHQPDRTYTQAGDDARYGKVQAVTAHHLWNAYLQLVAKDMSDSAARAKLAELFPADTSRVESVLVARRDLRRSSDPAAFNATVRNRASGDRRAAEALPHVIGNPGE